MRRLSSVEELDRPSTPTPPLETDVQYREVFEHISVCMFLVDVTADGRFKYAGFNPAEEKVIGLSSVEVSGKFVEEVFAEDVARKLIENYERCMEAGTPIAFDDELNLPSGSKYFHSNLIPMRNSDGRIHRIVGACIDTTDLKRTQAEAMARQKLESLGVLAAGIAHDFNNLLGSILSEAEVAEMEVAAGSSPNQEIRTIQEVATRAGEIVRELMIYAGQDQAKLDPVDLSQLVAEMLHLLKISISKHAILRVDLPEGLPAVLANAVQIRQVVMNLITNASEAIGDQRGVITVGISQVAGEDSTFRSAPDDGSGDFLRLTISDTGSGMTDEVRSRIFDPFFTTKFNGRGLGLAAVRGIIRGHDGIIDVTSAPGQGSCFEILLPSISDKKQKIQGAGRPIARSEPCTGTVLVIEDEQVLRQAASKMLRNEGFQVIEVGDGIAAIELLRGNAPISVILLDMTLPGKSGREVMEEVRRVRADTKVVLTSAYSRQALAAFGSQQPWAYIRKPYRLKELANLLKEAVAG